MDSYYRVRHGEDIEQAMHVALQTCRDFSSMFHKRCLLVVCVDELVAAVPNSMTFSSSKTLSKADQRGHSAGISVTDSTNWSKVRSETLSTNRSSSISQSMGTSKTHGSQWSVGVTVGVSFSALAIGGASVSASYGQSESTSRSSQRTTAVVSRIR